MSATRRSHRATGKPRGNPNFRKKAETPEPEEATAAPIVDEDEEAEGLTFEVEDAPEDEPEPELSGMARIRAAAAAALGKVGITSSSTASDGRGKPSDAVGGRLNKRQKDFADTITPALVGFFVLGSQWVWKRKGIEYVILAPDDDTATKIIAPLVRILARHSKNGGMSPDTLDLLASFGAVMAYGRYVHKNYAAVRDGGYQENYEQEQELEPGRIDTSYAGAGDVGGYEDSDISGHYRRAYRQQSDSAALSDAGSYGNASTFSPSNLSERERKQFEALRGLADKDFASRLRRSGRARGIHSRAS